jgi:hypothetical protein
MAPDAGRHSRGTKLMARIPTVRLLGGLGLVLGVAACSGTSVQTGNPPLVQCASGWTCGNYVDSDNDGNVSPLEWSNAFKAADTNGDGKLSPDEWKAGGGTWSGNAP